MAKCVCAKKDTEKQCPCCGKKCAVGPAHGVHGKADVFCMKCPWKDDGDTETE